jgi:hypothetical protein
MLQLHRPANDPRLVTKHMARGYVLFARHNRTGTPFLRSCAAGECVTRSQDQPGWQQPPGAM